MSNCIVNETFYYSYDDVAHYAGMIISVSGGPSWIAELRRIVTCPGEFYDYKCFQSVKYDMSISACGLYKQALTINCPDNTVHEQCKAALAWYFQDEPDFDPLQHCRSGY